MVLKTEHAIVGIIIALLVGSGAGYIYGQSPIAGYKEEIDRLETENLGIRESYDTLHSDHVKLTSEYSNLTEDKDTLAKILSLLERKYESLQNSYSSLQSSFDDLETEYGEFNSNYVDLLDTLNYLDAKNYSRTNNFNLTAGQSKSFTYDIGHGIIWKIDINFDGRKGWVGIYWRRGDQGGIITGGSDTLTEKLPYISGTANTEIYEDGDIINIFTSVMVTEFPSVSRTGDGRFQLDWTPTQPTIDGVVMLGEWPEFQDLRLDYDITFKLGKAADAEPWDTKDKIAQVSSIRDISNLYLFLKVPDDYVNDEYQIDGLNIHIVNPSIKKYIRWDKSGIRITGTDRHGKAEYNYKDNSYIIELKIPILSLINLEIEVSYVEATRYTVMGTFEESSYWVSNQFQVEELEVTVTEIPSIINGDFVTSTEGRPHEPEGWDFGGSGWMNRLSLWEHGTDLSQTVKLESSVEGIAFWVQPQPNGGEVSLELYVNEVLLYSNSYSGPDSYFESSRMIIPLDFLDSEPGEMYEIRFHVPPGPKTGAHVKIDNVTFIEFS